MEIMSWIHRIAISRDLRGQATQPLCSRDLEILHINIEKNFTYLLMGGEKTWELHLSHFYHVNCDSRAPTAFHCAWIPLTGSSGPSPGQEFRRLSAQTASVSHNLVNSDKSPNSHQVQITEDMQMTKGSSAYQGAFGLKDQMRKIFK